MLTRSYQNVYDITEVTVWVRNEFLFRNYVIRIERSDWKILPQSRYYGCIPSKRNCNVHRRKIQTVRMIGRIIEQVICGGLWKRRRFWQWEFFKSFSFFISGIEKQSAFSFAYVNYTRWYLILWSDLRPKRLR